MRYSIRFLSVRIARLLFLLLALIAGSCAIFEKNTSVLFVSFKDPGNSGIYYALSKDALNYEALNQGEAIVPVNDSITKMRDPFIARDPEKGFRLVWTCGRREIGYAWSPDLIDWSRQRILPIDAGNDSVTNTWAPELVYDEANKEWIIIYSSTILGEFPETKGQVKNKRNHRIYAVRTKDFKTISDPELFFNPAYPVIDATILKADDHFFMAFKDERDFPLRKQLRTATSESLNGPWTQISDTLTVSWSEGPSLLIVDKRYYLYYDYYKDPRHMGLLVSDDFISWSNITSETSFPHRYKHGSFLVLSKREASLLRKAWNTQETHKK